MDLLPQLSVCCAVVFGIDGFMGEFEHTDDGFARLA